jgi:hypothetical protein
MKYLLLLLMLSSCAGPRLELYHCTVLKNNEKGVEVHYWYFKSLSSSQAEDDIKELEPSAKKINCGES